MMSSGGGQLRLLRAAADDVTPAPDDVMPTPETAPAGAEARMHLRVARFIMEAGVKLGLGSVPLATACAAYHRFAGAVGPGAPYDPHLVAAAALFLAGKAEGQPLRARDVLNVAHRCLHPGQPPPGLDGGFWALRDSLVQCELLLLRVLRFRVAVPHPHKYLLHYLLALGRWGRRGGWGHPRVPGAAWALLRDGAAGGLGLRHPPQHLAAAALHLGLALCGRPPPPGAPPRWWQVLSPTLGPEELERIVRELLELYSLDAEVGGAPPAPPPAPRGRPRRGRLTDGRAGAATGRGTPARAPAGRTDGRAHGHRDGPRGRLTGSRTDTQTVGRTPGPTDRLTDRPQD